MNSINQPTHGVVGVLRSLEPLPPDALRWQCSLTNLPFETTAEVEPITGVVGQDDAVEALRFGLQTNAPGQNIFVRGLTGTGRMTLLKRLLDEIQLACPLTRDRCFVHNFAQPDRPRLITLPRNRGAEFRRQMDKLADFIVVDLRDAVSSERVKARRAALDRAAESELEKIMKPFNEALAAAGLSLVTIQAGPITRPAILPLVDDKPIPLEEFERLHAQGQVSDELFAAVQDSQKQYAAELDEIGAKVNDIRRRHDRAVQDLLEKDARWLLKQLTDAIQTDFPEPEVAAFLADVVEDVVTNRLQSLGEEDDFDWLYRVNVVLDQREQTGCPIVLENTPTVRNLLGTIDFEYEPGAEPRASHLGIRAGSLLRADGGFLVLEAREVLTEPTAWRVLVRALRTGRLEITPPDMAFFSSVATLKPEPIDISVKVILLGDAEIYYLLDEEDSDFPHLFKVLADFDTTIPRDERGISEYAGVLARIAQTEQLAPFDREAVAVLVEHGARIAAQREKLSTRFGRLADLAREAAFVARELGHQAVTGEDVRSAIRRNRRRADLPARRFREYIADGTIRIQTQGAVVGQVNGLAVLQAGPLTYGFPARITATIGPGTAGVINIEREAALSGSIHTKGFYILGGLLRWLLRTDHPLAFNASVAFEQSYGGIDGDSASGAEICCLLSALTDVPLRQDLAMTGAIDQMGNILPIGGVNEKIEGFFDACRDTALTGTQGVIIPQANAGDLMLREDVVDACRQGTFHVYAIETIQKAMELFTGLPAGTRDTQGRYPEKSLLGRAVKQAHDYWIKIAQTPPAKRPGRRSSD